MPNSSSTLNQAASPALELKAIAKSYGPVQVLRDVSFFVSSGEVVMLVGENGAGKSTLKNILVGLASPDRGEILLQSKIHRHLTAKDARELGISAIHQELSLFSNLSVAQNIFMPDLPRRGIFLDNQKMNARATELLTRLGLEIDPSAIVGSLSLGKRQLVEIAKAIHHSSSVLILDEPTSSLSITERKNLHGVVRKLKAEGYAIIYITHFFEEVYELGDRAVVLRDGQVVAQGAVNAITQDELSSAMVGREASIKTLEIPKLSIDAKVVLRTKALSDTYLKDISFTLRRGEILGLAGLMGAGRSEVASAIVGTRKTKGSVEINGREINRRTPAAMRDAGLVCVTEDRRNDQAFLNRSTAENITSATLDRYVGRRLPVINRAEERKRVYASIDRYRVQPKNSDIEFGNLSGGNQQKAILARWLMANPDVCILDEPTKGVDINARNYIHQLIVEHAEAGQSFLLISSDMPELLAMSHRILVMHKGGLAGEFERDTFDPSKILRVASTGVQQ